MSYHKAMKHARNVRKTRKQSRMHFGFDTGSGRWPAAPPVVRKCQDVQRWLRMRHKPQRAPDGTLRSAQYQRDCIREAIAELRVLRAEEAAALREINAAQNVDDPAAGSLARDIADPTREALAYEQDPSA